MTDVTQYRLRKNHILLMQRTVKTLGNLLQLTTPEAARTYRDSGTGWTVLEVLCHLRDFNGFFYLRAQMILNQDNPALPAYDHEALAIERRYNEQDLYAVYDDLVTMRGELVQFFENLSDEQWARAGKHPERTNPFSLLDAAMQIGHHDANHIEQITRILAEKQSAAATA